LLAIFGVLSGLMIVLLMMSWRNWQARADAAERLRQLTALATLLRAELPPLPASSENAAAVAARVSTWGEQLGLSIVVVNARGEVLASSGQACRGRPRAGRVARRNRADVPVDWPRGRTARATDTASAGDCGGR
jgi:hypothetical protein